MTQTETEEKVQAIGELVVGDRLMVPWYSDREQVVLELNPGRRAGWVSVSLAAVEDVKNGDGAMALGTGGMKHWPVTSL